MIERIVHLGFEVRVELVREDGERLSVQITRDEAEQLELEQGQIVFVRPTRQTTFVLASPATWAPAQCGCQASRVGRSSSRDSARQLAGSRRRRAYAHSSTRRRLARTATQTSRSGSADPA